MQSLNRNRVPLVSLAGPDVLVIAPPLPVHPDDGADLAVQEAVGEADEESLEGEKNIPCEDEDCLQCCLRMRRAHYSDKVGDPKERDDDYQGLHGSQVHILCLVVVMMRP